MSSAELCELREMCKRRMGEITSKRRGTIVGTLTMWHMVFSSTYDGAIILWRCMKSIV
jgi:hypothetical protein